MQPDLTSPGQLDVAVSEVDVSFRVEQTRVLGLLYLSGSLLVAISLAFPWWPDADRSDGAGLTDSDGDGVREVDGAPIAFSIKVPGNEPTYVRAAELLAEQFAEIGLQATVEQVDPGTIGGLFRSREFDTYVTGAPTHGVADPTQFIMSQESGYLWDLPEVAYPEMAELVDQWRTTETVDGRTDKLYEMERLFNSQPTSIPLYYPEGPMAFRADTYGGWVESPGYGLFHKWSLLPRDIARRANAIVEPAN